MILSSSKLKPLVLAVALSGLFGAQAHAASAFSAPVVLQDTATNLSVSWVWDTTFATSIPFADISAAPLTFWSAEASGWKQSLRTGSVYVIDIVADHTPSALSFEYEAGTFANNNAVSFHNSAIIGGRTYTLDINQGPSNASLWNVNLTAVAAVPEPESYAMLLAGLGLMGTIARRRSKSKAV